MSFKLTFAQRLGEKIAAELQPYCERLEIAGSIRRRREFVNDIDIVAQPKEGQLHALRERFKRNSRVVTDGDQSMIVVLPPFTHHGSRITDLQLDLWIARRPEADLLQTKPGNFGSLLLCRTGSKEHNIWLCQRAESLGLRWNPYAGVFDGHGNCLAWESEEAIFRALNLDFIPPEKRER
jgi:DNA polymerase (family 10)